MDASEKWKTWIEELFMRVFEKELIKYKHYALDKKSCLNEMVEHLHECGIIDSPDIFFKLIMEREKMMSTGIGRQVAIPHARSDTVLSMKIAAYLLDNELEFEAIDELPVKIILMIAVPESMKEAYMKVLSAISNFFRIDDNRNRILQAASLDELWEILEELNDEI